jgi:hypothetical protein
MITRFFRTKLIISRFQFTKYELSVLVSFYACEFGSLLENCHRDVRNRFTAFIDKVTADASGRFQTRLFVAEYFSGQRPDRKKTPTRIAIEGMRFIAIRLLLRRRRIRFSNTTILHQWAMQSCLSCLWPPIIRSRKLSVLERKYRLLQSPRATAT